MQIDFNNLTEAQKQTIFNIGLLTIAQSIFESINSVDKLQRNMTTLREKTGFSEEEIWKCYEFLSNGVIAMGKLKTREAIGFNLNHS